MKITVARFTKDKTLQWNEFVDTAVTSLFLFNRAYMEYHEDRFLDHSLMIYKQEKLVALFPANEKQKIIYSHAGLTYGGMLLSKEVKGKDTLKILELIINYYSQLGFIEMYYKAIPYIFSSSPGQEDLYALFRHNAVLYRRDISSVVDLSAPVRFSETKRQAITKCSKAGIAVQETSNFTEYWKLLTSVLEKFGVKPVHTIDEIIYLKERLPGKIKLFEARDSGELLAGIVIYDYNRVVHTQYMANSSKGRTMAALDFINAHLITNVFKDREYYSFGISTEDDGKILNEGLLQQKEMMGGRAIVNDFYKIVF